MVTQQVEQLARQSYFDALAELFVAPDHADTYDRLRDALHAVAGPPRLYPRAMKMTPAPTSPRVNMPIESASRSFSFRSR